MVFNFKKTLRDIWMTKNMPYGKLSKFFIGKKYKNLVTQKKMFIETKTSNNSKNS